MGGDQLVEQSPGDVLQKPVQHAIVVTHGVWSLLCPEPPASARNSGESTPCTSSSKNPAGQPWLKPGNDDQSRCVRPTPLNTRRGGIFRQCRTPTGRHSPARA